MFTGIVEEIGQVGRLERRGSSGVLQIRARQVLEGTKIGDSIAVNGACLTVTAIADRYFIVDLAPETLRRTVLGRLGPGNRVNLERALAVTARIGGHFVQGHVDGIGEVRALRPEDESVVVAFAAPPSIMRYIVPKGFIAVDGMSLTVAERRPDGFTISFVPQTLTHTVAGEYEVGTEVNLEADILGKYVEQFLERRETTPEPRLNREFLAQHGFLN